MKKILITAPLRQEPKIFQEYQESLDRLIIPDGFTVERFFIVNDCPEVIPFIKNAAYITHDTGDRYTKVPDDHLWTTENFHKMSNLRNMTIIFALNGGFDYWLSADTDLVLNPHTLEYLIAADKDICAEVFWTVSKCGLWPNAWMYDQCDYGDQSDNWEEPGLYQVGGTGALLLVKRRVFEAGVGYARIPNIKNVLVGEDRFFSVRAACAGFDIWLDTHAPAWHMYNEQMYQEWMKVRNNADRDKTGTWFVNRDV